jgi:hypothetical protein
VPATGNTPQDRVEVKRDGETPPDCSAENSEIVGIARHVAKDVTGGNCTCADDDIRVLGGLAKWALQNGVPDELCPAVIYRAKKHLAGESMVYSGKEGAKICRDHPFRRIQNKLALRGKDDAQSNAGIVTFLGREIADDEGRDEYVFKAKVEYPSGPPDWLKWDIALFGIPVHIVKAVELEALREFHAAATAYDGHLEVAHDSSCPILRIGGTQTCTCGAAGRQDRIDEAEKAIAAARVIHRP